MAPFGPKPWVNPFGKMSIFRHFELLVFKAQKGVFSFQNFVKDIFWPILPKKKRLKKWPVLDQSQGLTPFEKCQFSDFLHFLFLQPKKAFFRPRIFLNKFYWPILLKKIFRLFRHLVLIAQKSLFSFQNIVKHIFLPYIV